MVKRKINYGLYLITFVASLVIFISGLMVANMINDAKISSISKDLAYLEELRSIQETNMLLLDSLGEKKCDALSHYQASMVPELEELGKRVDMYESSSDGKRYLPGDYEMLKRSYTLLLIKYWTLSKTLEKDCSVPIDDILYFYSSNCEGCESQGIILNSIKKSHPETMIFSIDGELDLSPVIIIKHSYNVTQYPTLIVNSRQYEGLVSKDDLISLLETGKIEK
ncbi:MAG: hypothetical protein JW727_01930 [Candidatus Aenigmarchaeota archaeon]|nr:hypothetical protein [Candidatus Aenigmarchaeota archaeon]